MIEKDQFTTHRNTDLVIHTILVVVLGISFAVTPAAADATEAERTLDASTVAPEDSVTVTLVVEFDEEKPSVSIQDAYDGPVSSVTIDSVSAGGTSVEPTIEIANDDALSIGLENIGAGESIEVRYTVSVDGTADATVEFDGRSGADVTAGADEANFGVDTLSLEQLTNTPGQSPDDGTATPDVSDDDASPIGDANPRFYVGQKLERDTDVAATETLDLVHPDDSTTLVTADSAGIATIDTTSLAPGQYALQGEDGSEVARFRLIEQTFSTFVFESDSTQTAGTDTTATLSITTNRRSTVHHLTAASDGETVDSSTLQSILDGRGTQVDDETLRLEGSNQEAYTLDFEGLDEGTFELTTSVPDSTATASDSIELRETTSGEASFQSQQMSETVGETMEIPITIDGTEGATLEVGAEDVNYHVRMNVHDRDSDGQITVLWHTDVAGNEPDESGAFSADGADEVTNVERTTNAFSGQIAHGVQDGYSLSLSVGDNETALGLATLTPPPDRPLGDVCGKDLHPLLDSYEANLDDVPDFAVGFVTDETAHLIVEGDDDSDYTVVTGPGKQVTETEQSAPQNPSLEVKMDCETVTSIVESSNTNDAVTEAYENDDIEVERTNPLEDAALTVGETLHDVGTSLGIL